MGIFSARGMTKPALLSVGLSCCVLLGCAAPPRNPSPADYVFFGNQTELKQISAPPGVFLYANPNKPLRDEDRFIVEPARIAFQPESAYWLDSSKSQELADFLRQAVITSLAEGYKVVDTPAEGVLRVSLIVADIRRRTPSDSDRAPQTEPQYQPFLIVSITDPTTGTGVFLLRDLNRGNELAAVAKSDEAAARRVLSDWAKTLRNRLEHARRAATPQPATQP
jgi:hypothetical protein